MVKKIMCITITLVLCAAAFYAGTKWKERTLGTLPMYHLKESIKLQLSPEHIGSLPAGSTIYKYSAKGETVTYFVFFSMENRMIIERFRPKKFNTVSPLSGYKD